MKVIAHAGGVAMTNAILVADEKSREAVLFDAPDHTVGAVLDKACGEGWNVSGLWLTHGHFDHIADHAVWRERFPNGKSRIHELETAKVLHPQVQTRLFGLPFDIPPLKADCFVTDEEELHIGSIPVKVLHTSGHSAGHVCYYFPTEKLLIGGDLIIGGSVGRTDLPDSNPADLQKSLQRVMSLPDDTTLLGGHGPATTLGEERETNPFVRMALGLD